jgi:hypothetical protein
MRIQERERKGRRREWIPSGERVGDVERSEADGEKGAREEFKLEGDLYVENDTVHKSIGWNF